MPRPRKHQPPLDESGRVSAWRRRRMHEQAYKSVSFLASPEEFALLEAARSRYGLTTKELMMHYLSGRYLTEPLQAEPAEDTDIADPEIGGPSEEDSRAQRIEEHLLKGELFRLPSRQEYVLLTLYLNLERLPGWFPFDREVLRDFASLREALQYYCLRRGKIPPARQVLLLRKTDQDLYHVCLRLNQIYPQIAEQLTADSPDYRGEFERMLAEYANEGD